MPQGVRTIKNSATGWRTAIACRVRRRGLHIALSGQRPVHRWGCRRLASAYRRNRAGFVARTSPLPRRRLSMRAGSFCAQKTDARVPADGADQSPRMCRRCRNSLMWPRAVQGDQAVQRGFAQELILSATCSPLCRGARRSIGHREWRGKCTRERLTIAGVPIGIRKLQTKVRLRRWRFLRSGSCPGSSLPCPEMSRGCMSRSCTWRMFTAGRCKCTR
jgi:hypothetical protein